MSWSSGVLLTNLFDPDSCHWDDLTFACELKCETLTGKSHTWVKAERSLGATFVFKPPHRCHGMFSVWMEIAKMFLSALEPLSLFSCNVLVVWWWKITFLKADTSSELEEFLLGTEASVLLAVTSDLTLDVQLVKGTLQKCLQMGGVCLVAFLFFPINACKERKGWANNYCNSLSWGAQRCLNLWQTLGCSSLSVTELGWTLGCGKSGKSR